MKTIHTLLAVIVLVGLAGCRTAPSSVAAKRDFSGSPATEFVVSISSSAPGTKFTGTLAADGTTEAVSGDGAGRWHIKAHKLVCSFKKTEGEGSLVLSVSEGGQPLGHSVTRDASVGVRAEFLRTPSAQHTLFTTF